MGRQVLIGRGPQRGYSIWSSCRKGVQSLLRGEALHGTEGFSVKGGRHTTFLKGLGDSYVGGAWSDWGASEETSLSPPAQARGSDLAGD